MVAGSSANGRAMSRSSSAERSDWAMSSRTRATASLALAPWTLPHELARLVLAEQLYRAGTIVRGEPYHK